ncbi:hypothetical protein HMPREF3213_02184 [Heyndrickxia coagulans]|uniref:Uncharacterized protein n=1 Tax=Heyndrickxia coagulans TaxID=1398 RepID=A0A133KNB6_HEYCO|nr:hypothetical protein HMPREF3213_02184 [Heyndrickxia coagulans]
MISNTTDTANKIANVQTIKYVSLLQKLFFLFSIIIHVRPSIFDKKQEFMTKVTLKNTNRAGGWCSVV